MLLPRVTKVLLSIGVLLVLLAMHRDYRWLILHGLPGQSCAESILNDEGLDISCDGFINMVVVGNKTYVSFHEPGDDRIIAYKPSEGVTEDFLGYDKLIGPWYVLR